VTVIVGPGCSSVTVIVGPGRGTVTVTVGCGTGTLTVTVGAAFRPCCRLVAPRRAGNVIATISASPMAAAIASKALDRSRFRSCLRCLLPGRGACGVITPLMVDPGAARAATALSYAARAPMAFTGWLRRRRHTEMTMSTARLRSPVVAS